VTFTQIFLLTGLPGLVVLFGYVAAKVHERHRLMIRPSAMLFLLCVPAMAAEPATAIIQMERRDARLIQYGEQAMQAGNLTAARRLLKRPALAGNAEAARRIADTYDPVWQAQHGVVGVAWLADPDAAIQWYKLAAELGDDEPGNRYLEAGE